jgi:phosphoenolpyruvate carboxykinase (ATP)
MPIPVPRGSKLHAYSHVTEPQATFSACFGAPFMPRPPQVYGELFRRLITQSKVQCWLLNTGWTGGPYGEGQRMPLATTRAVLNCILDGSLNSETYRTDKVFGFEVPAVIPGLNSSILDPRTTWPDALAYDLQAERLLAMFQENNRKLALLVAA